MVTMIVFNLATLAASILVLVSGSSILRGPNATEEATAACTITQYSQVEQVIKSCTNIILSNVKVPSGKTLGLHLKDGTTLTIRGSLFHGSGEKYWDGHGGVGGVTKPSLLRFHTINNSVIKNISLKNCPMFCTSIVKANGLTIDGYNIDNSAGDKLGKNTDGIGISWSSNIRIENAFIHNQDECLYVNSGSNMYFNRIHCVNSNGIAAKAGYQSTYDGNTTRNITFHNCLMEGGLTGVQIIAVAKGGSGEVNDITFQNVELKGVKDQGMFIQMDFGNKGHVSNTIAVKRLKMSHIYGTVAKGAKDYYIICGKLCSDWTFSNVDVTG